MNEKRPLAEVRSESGFASQVELGSACDTDSKVISRAESSGKVGRTVAYRILGALNARRRVNALPLLSVEDIAWTITTQGRKKGLEPIDPLQQDLLRLEEDCYPVAVALGAYAAQVLISSEQETQQALYASLHQVVETAQNASLTVLLDTLKQLRKKRLQEWSAPQPLAPLVRPRDVTEDAWQYVVQSEVTCLAIFLAVVGRWLVDVVADFGRRHHVKESVLQGMTQQVVAQFLKSVLVDYEYRLAAHLEHLGIECYE